MIVVPAIIAQRLHAALPRRREGRRIGRVDIAGQGETIAIGALHEIEHHGAPARLYHPGELGEMLGAALGDRIGEFRQPDIAQEMDILHFDIAGRRAVRFEENIDA